MVSAIIVFILRISLMLSLYAFLVWAFYTIWRELHINGLLISARKVPVLRILPIDPPDETVYEFSTPEVIIGREQGCDYCLQDETVSARHTRLSYHHNQWWVEDLNSTNGTFLNDERVTLPTVIISEDDFRIGKVVLNLTINPQ